MRWIVTTCLSFQEFGGRWSQVGYHKFTQILILLRESYCHLTGPCDWWSVGARSFQEGSLPTDRPRSMIPSMRNNVGFCLVLQDRQNRRCTIGHLSSYDQGQIVGNVVSPVVTPNWVWVQKKRLGAHGFEHVPCSTVRERNASVNPVVSLRYALSGGFSNRCILKVGMRFR